MHNEYKIRELTDKQDAAFESVGNLFEEMYAYMREHGLMLDLAEDGAQKWIKSVQTGLGRFGGLFICEQNEEIIGFAHGSIRLTPDYLGSQKVGVITHLHLKQEFRGLGAGNALVKALEGWFENNNIASIELQVLSANDTAIGFWEKLGYNRELHQYRKIK